MGVPLFGYIIDSRAPRPRAQLLVEAAFVEWQEHYTWLLLFAMIRAICDLFKKMFAFVMRNHIPSSILPNIIHIQCSRL